MYKRQVLGLILFVIYINDVDNSLNCKILKFADDTKIFRTIYSEEDIYKLQTDSCDLVAWSEDWQMLFNVDMIIYWIMAADYRLD